MKKFNFITDGDFLEWYQEVSRIHKELAEGIIPLTKENILMEPEVCDLPVLRPVLCASTGKRSIWVLSKWKV